MIIEMTVCEELRHLEKALHVDGRSDACKTLNCAGIKTRSRAPVVIKTNKRSMATACDHWVACGIVILQACSKYQTEKGSCARRVRIAAPLFAPFS